MKIALGEGIRHIHFIGIGGISMSGLAEILHRDGYTISGSDWTSGPITQKLSEMGITFLPGTNAAHITPAIDLVVYTAAVKPNNPELAAARLLAIPTIDRATLLGSIMRGYPYSVAVAGTHGKTTTTAVLSEVFLAADLDPTITIGGMVESIGGNIRVGASPYLLLEACEYFDSFLQFHPHIGVILNIDLDHLDYFGTMERVQQSFCRFAQNIPPEGTLVIHGGIPLCREVTAGLPCRVFTYGTATSRFQAVGLRYDEKGLPAFTIQLDGKPLCRVHMQLRGLHNIGNALAAAAVATALGIPMEAVKTGLERAVGAKRRFEHKGTLRGACIVDDYAHHPTEIRTTLEAVKRGPYKRVICAFQSHTYSRTQNLLEDFAKSFAHADTVLILPIYAAREALAAGTEPNHLSLLLTERIRGHGKDALFMEDFDAAAAWLEGALRPGDLLLTMGAGDIHILGERLLSRHQESSTTTI